MKKKKTLSLVIAIVLSLSIFVSNLQAIRIVRATEAEIEGDEETVVQQDPAVLQGTADQTTVPASDALGQTQQAEGQTQEAVQPQEVTQPQETSQPDAAAQQEAARQEAARQAEELARQEAAKKEAEEREAKEAQERQAQAEKDAAAQEALKKAQEEEAKARKEAEEARKAAEEAKKAEEAKDYKLSANVGSVNFGTAAVGVQRDPKEIQVTNTGGNDVNLMFMESDPEGVFDCTLVSGSTKLAVGQTARYTVSMRSNAIAGKYNGSLTFADADRDARKGVTVALYGEVKGEDSVVSGVTVVPAKVSVAVASKYKFSATVNASGNASRDVIWSIANHRSTDTTISKDGTLSIGSNETSGQITVTATSAANNSISGYAIVTPQKGSYNVSAYAEPSNGGKVTGGGAVSEGGTVRLTAAPNKNFVFTGWVQGKTTVSRSTNYTISDVRSNISVVARFERNYVTVRAEPNTSNGGTVVGGGKVSYNGSTTLSAKAYSGYAFIGWREDGKIISRDASLRLKDLKDDRQITGVFDRTSYTVSVSANPEKGGKVTGGGKFSLGDHTTITAKPASGYSFDGWKVNGHYVSRKTSFDIDWIDSDYNCTAVFFKDGVSTYQISAGVATTGGSISPSGKNIVEEGENVTYTITPKSGYAVLAVAVDGEQVGAKKSYTFSNVRGNHTISAAFVLTDSGKTAAQEAGQTVQEQKVQPVQKTAANTATAESTVSIKEAVAGTGGDEYVEEMNLSAVPVPTDEELGVLEEEEESSPVTQMLGVSAEEARAMVASGNHMDILDAAFFAGTLEAYADNALEPAALTGINYQDMTAEELMQASADDINPSLPNLDVVVEKMLTDDEVMTLVDGGTESVTVSLTKQDSPEPAEAKIMKNAIGQKPVQYFDLTLMKTVEGYTENVTELPKAMEVVIEVPEEIYKSGKTYSVLRVHDGELKVLPDLDDDPETITFRTDQFSSYAIAEQVASSRTMVLYFAMGATIAFIAAVACLVVLLHQQTKRRRARRRAHATKRNQDRVIPR